MLAAYPASYPPPDVGGQVLEGFARHPGAEERRPSPVLWGCKTDIVHVLLVSPVQVAGLSRPSAQRVWCWPPGSPAACRGVELCHEIAVGSAGGAEFFIAFFQLEAQVKDLLLQTDGLLAELVQVGGMAEAALTPGPFAEGFG